MKRLSLSIVALALAAAPTARAVINWQTVTGAPGWIPGNGLTLTASDVGTHLTNPPPSNALESNLLYRYDDQVNPVMVTINSACNFEIFDFDPTLGAVAFRFTDAIAPGQTCSIDFTLSGAPLERVRTAVDNNAAGPRPVLPTDAIAQYTPTANQAGFNWQTAATGADPYYVADDPNGFATALGDNAAWVNGGQTRQVNPTAGQSANGEQLQIPLIYGDANWFPNNFMYDSGDPWAGAQPMTPSSLWFNSFNFSITAGATEIPALAEFRWTMDGALIPEPTRLAFAAIALGAALLRRSRRA